MKKIYFLMIAILFAATTSAQNPIFEKGNTAINVGVGVGDRGLPIEVSGIYGIVDDLFNVNGLTLGVGGYLGFNSWKESIFSRFDGFGVLPGIRGEVHYSIVDKLDFFGGFLFGIEFDKWDGILSSGFNTSRHYFISVPYLGAKYFITENFGFYASTGYGMTYLSAGISLQF